MYFAASLEGSMYVWRIPATGGTKERVTHRPRQLAFDSMDSKTLFFTHIVPSSDQTPLFALPLGGGSEQRVVDCVRCFDVGSAGVYYLGCAGDKEGRLPLYLLDPVTRRSQLLGQLEGAAGLITVSSDGKTILYQKGRAVDRSDLMMIEHFR